MSSRVERAGWREQANRDEATARNLSSMAEAEYAMQGKEGPVFATLAQVHATLALLNQQRADAAQAHADMDLLWRMMRVRA